ISQCFVNLLWSLQFSSTQTGQFFAHRSDHDLRIGHYFLLERLFSSGFKSTLTYYTGKSGKTPVAMKVSPFNLPFKVNVVVCHVRIEIDIYSVFIELAYKSACSHLRTNLIRIPNRLELPRALETIRFDRGNLKQSFHNLLTSLIVA